MTKIALALLSLLAVSSPALGQDGDAQLKKRILEKVRARMAADRAALLDRIGKIIDEELSAPAPAPAPAPKDDAAARMKELERQMRLLEERKEMLAAEMAKQKRLAEDDDVRKEAAKDGPHDIDEAREMFENALELHDKQKNFRSSVRLFKRIYYQFPKTSLGVISAYNAACGYSLSGQKEAALDWLELCIQGGYNDFEHLRQDPDLDALRDEKRYMRMMTDR